MFEVLLGKYGTCRINIFLIYHIFLFYKWAQAKKRKNVRSKFSVYTHTHKYISLTNWILVETASIVVDVIGNDNDSSTAMDVQPSILSRYLFLFRHAYGRVPQVVSSFRRHFLLSFCIKCLIWNEVISRFIHIIIFTLAPKLQQAPTLMLFVFFSHFRFRFINVHSLACFPNEKRATQPRIPIFQFTTISYVRIIENRTLFLFKRKKNIKCFFHLKRQINVFVYMRPWIIHIQNTLKSKLC